MDTIEKYKKSFLESALDEFGRKYHGFCLIHTCATCALAPDDLAPGVHDSIKRIRQCRVNVIDHLTEANRKMDEALEKEAEIKKKKENTAKYLTCAIKAEKRDLEYRNKRDADYIVLNPDDKTLLETVPGFVMCCRMGGEPCSELFGMRVKVDHDLERGKFVIGFKTDSHIKEVTE